MNARRVNVARAPIPVSPKTSRKYHGGKVKLQVVPKRAGALVREEHNPNESASPRQFSKLLEIRDRGKAGLPLADFLKTHRRTFWSFFRNHWVKPQTNDKGVEVMVIAEAGLQQIANYHNAAQFDKKNEGRIEDYMAAIKLARKVYGK